jgi:hypothetical protein
MTLQVMEREIQTRDTPEEGRQPFFAITLIAVLLIMMACGIYMLSQGSANSPAAIRQYANNSADLTRTLPQLPPGEKAPLP